LALFDKSKAISAEKRVPWSDLLPVSFEELSSFEDSGLVASSTSNDPLSTPGTGHKQKSTDDL
jgi:hypothetical protein